MCEICAQFNPFAGDWLHDHIVVQETIDAPGDDTTQAEIAAGDSFEGVLTLGDVDWIELSVDIGEAYTISTSAGAGDAVQDTFLVLYDADGNQLDIDDDGGSGYYSEINFTASGTTYYAAVMTYQSWYGYNPTDEGSYVLDLGVDGGGTSNTTLPTYTTDQIVDQLINGYWNDTGRSARSWDVSVEGGSAGVITVNYSAMTAAGQWFAQEALDLWSAVSGLTFSVVSSGADITFDDESSGAYASTSVYGNGDIASVFINVSQSWISGDHYDYETYSLQTFIHEIGHALGLGHAGNYNAGSGGPITYAGNAEFTNDSWQATVMSYFSQIENTAINASYAYLLTPMIADIESIRSHYGTAGNLRTGDTVYGVGSTAGDVYDTLATTYDNMAFTLVDDGGEDTVNFSDSAYAQIIDLNAESYSSVGGESGNMAIARNTVIENAVSGSGADTITGNGVANKLWSGEGADSVTGGDGNDEISGQNGDDDLSGGDEDDKLWGGNGADQLTGDAGDDALMGGWGNDTLTGGDGNDWLSGDGNDDVIDGGTGTDTASYQNAAWWVDINLLQGTAAGGDGTDTLTNIENAVGSGYGDVLVGGYDGNVLTGKAGNDWIWAKSGDDYVYGGGGHDAVFGGWGADKLYGHDGNDTLNGEQGHDVVNGGGGDDRLDGGLGDDYLWGDTGADTFVFAQSGGTDTIGDFEDGSDLIDLSDWGFSAFSEVVDLAQFYASSVNLLFSDGSVLKIRQLTEGSFDAGDVLLVV